MAIEYKGFDKLDRRLTALKAELSSNGMKRMVRAGARVFKKELVDRTPVLDAKTANSTALDPGALKAGIRTAMSAKETPVTAHVGPNKKVAHVARFVEYGHRDVHGGQSKATAKGNRGAGTAGAMDVQAHPFIRPAYESARGDAEAAMMAEVNAMVRGV